LGFRDQVSCLRCDSEPFTAARAVGLYEGALHEAVLMLKRQPHLPAYVEELVVAAAMREPLNASTVIMPVPLHPKRLRSRGFNQAAVIAEAVSKRLRLPLDEVSLVRVSATDKYRAGLDAKGRRDTVAGAFAVRHTRVVAACLQDARQALCKHVDATPAATVWPKESLPGKRRTNKQPCGLSV